MAGDKQEDQHITYKIITVRGIEVAVGRNEAGQQVDIKAKLTDKQAQDLREHNKNNAVDWEESSYTYLLYNQLSEYQHHRDHDPNTPKELDTLFLNLRKLTTAYSKLEELVNNPNQFKDPLGELLKRLDALIKQIVDSDLPEEMKDRLLNAKPNGVRAFREQVQAFRNNNPTAQEIRLFLRVQPIDENSRLNLGVFLGKNLRMLCKEAEEQTFQILDKHAPGGPLVQFWRNNVNKHPLALALNNAGSYIERRMSLRGVLRNNTHNAVDPTMIEAVEHQDNPDDKVQKWTSINGFINPDGSLTDLDRAFSDLADGYKNPKDRKDSPTARFAVFMGSFAEMIWSPVYRVAATVITLPFAILGKVLLPEKTFNRLFNAWESLVDRGHGALSKLFGSVAGKNYRNKKSEDLDQNTHKLQTEPKSFFSEMFRHANGKALGGLIGGALIGAAKGVVAAVRFILWDQIGTRVIRLGEMITGIKTDIPAVVKRRDRKLYDKQLEAGFRNKVKVQYNKMVNQTVPAPQNQAPGLAGPARQEIQPWLRNDFTNPIAFFDEIFVGLADVLISPVFRNSPGIAVPFFLLAHASMGVMTAPSMAASLMGASAKGGFMMVGKYVALDFMGKHAGSSMMTNMLTAFLEFKLPVFMAEGVKEACVGDGEFLRSVLANPEKALLAFAVLVGGSGALSFAHCLVIPEIPEGFMTVSIHSPLAGHKEVSLTNPVGAVLEVFAAEAHEVQAEGLYPLTTLEFGFLALKLGLLTAGIVECAHDNAIDQSQKELAIALISPVFENGQYKKFGPNEQARGAQKLIRDLRAQFAVLKTGKPLAELLNQKEEAIEQLIKPVLIANGIEPGPLLNRLCDEAFNLLVESCKDNEKNNTQAAEGFKAAQAMEKDLQRAKMDTASKARLQKEHSPSHSPTPREALLDLMNLIELNAMGDDQMDYETAKALYNQLYAAFKNYNNAQREAGNWDQQIDKNEVLGAFYNKYIRPHEEQRAGVALMKAIFISAPARMVRGIFGRSSKDPSAEAHARHRVKIEKGMQYSWGFAALGGLLFRPAMVYSMGWGKTLSLGLQTAALYAVGIPLSIPGILAYPFVGGRLLTATNRMLSSWASGIRRAAGIFDTQDLTSSEKLKAKAAKRAHHAGVSSQGLKEGIAQVKEQLVEHEVEGASQKSSGIEDYHRKYEDKSGRKRVSERKERREEKKLMEQYDKGMKSLYARIALLQKLPKGSPGLSEVSGILKILKGFEENTSTLDPATLRSRANELRGYAKDLDRIEALQKHHKAGEAPTTHTINAAKNQSQTLPQQQSTTNSLMESMTSHLNDKRSLEQSVVDHTCKAINTGNICMTIGGQKCQIMAKQYIDLTESEKKNVSNDLARTFKDTDIVLFKAVRQSNGQLKFEPVKYSEKLEYQQINLKSFDEAVMNQAHKLLEPIEISPAFNHQNQQ